MPDDEFDQSAWERRWSQVLRESPDKVANRPPSPYLLSEIADLEPGHALDAGCGHGSEAIWLAGTGWRVTAVDFSATALDYGRSSADAGSADIADRIEWVATSAPGPPSPVVSTSSAVSTSTWPGPSSRW